MPSVARRLCETPITQQSSADASSDDSPPLFDHHFHALVSTCRDNNSVSMSHLSVAPSPTPSSRLHAAVRVARSSTLRDQVSRRSATNIIELRLPVYKRSLHNTHEVQPHALVHPTPRPFMSAALGQVDHRRPAHRTLHSILPSHRAHFTRLVTLLLLPTSHLATVAG